MSAFPSPSSWGDEILRPGASVPLADLPSFRPSHGRRTSPCLTKYERTRLLGTAAVRHHHGTKPNVELRDGDDPLSIARRELASRRLPVTVRRHFPDGSSEQWPLSDLWLFKVESSV